jgi:hypothetical protein
MDNETFLLTPNLLPQYNGTAIDNPSAANLSITIVMAEVQPARAADQFPVSSNFSTLNARSPNLAYI